MDTLKQLYVAFICPHLEYETAVWDPHLSKDIQELYNVSHVGSVQKVGVMLAVISCIP